MAVSIEIPSIVILYTNFSTLCPYLKGGFLQQVMFSFPSLATNRLLPSLQDRSLARRHTTSMGGGISGSGSLFVCLLPSLRLRYRMIMKKHHDL
ncbi:MAG: hypothetical protein D6736_03370 [Nitrospinota bacterium]|nr:MAG: hypothetical protein D6736_03370 [Nitrospinota bacterium]